MINFNLSNECRVGERRPDIVGSIEISVSSYFVFRVEMGTPRPATSTDRGWGFSGWHRIDIVCLLVKGTLKCSVKIEFE